jgi:hypothetical protein
MSGSSKKAAKPRIETIYRTHDGQVWETMEEARVHMTTASLREAVASVFTTLEQNDIHSLAERLVGEGGWSLVIELGRALKARGVTNPINDEEEEGE